MTQLRLWTSQMSSLMIKKSTNFHIQKLIILELKLRVIMLLYFSRPLKWDLDVRIIKYENRDFHASFLFLVFS